MTERRLKMLEKVGASVEDTQPRDRNADLEDAICELAEMLAAQDDAIVELAEIIGGAE